MGWCCRRYLGCRCLAPTQTNKISYKSWFSTLCECRAQILLLINTFSFKYKYIIQGSSESRSSDELWIQCSQHLVENRHTGISNHQFCSTWWVFSVSCDPSVTLQSRSTNSNQEKPTDWTTNMIQPTKKTSQEKMPRASNFKWHLNGVFDLFQGTSWAPSTTCLVPTCPHSRRRRWALWARGSSWHRWVASMQVRPQIVCRAVSPVNNSLPVLLTRVLSSPPRPPATPHVSSPRKVSGGRLWKVSLQASLPCLSSFFQPTSPLLITKKTNLSRPRPSPYPTPLWVKLMKVSTS